MTVYNKLTVGGTTYSDMSRMTVKSSVGTNNSASTFTVSFLNINGSHSTDFNIGQEVIIYADKDVNPPTTVILTGIVENVKFTGRGIDEVVEIKGRDYTARLMDVTVEPEVYNNQEVSVIVTDIISKYVTDITTTNVDVTSTQLTYIAFNQLPVFDALKQLASLSDFIFWVDVNKDLNFKAKGGTSSGVTLDNTNILSSTFKRTDSELYNQIFVYGDRTLNSWQNTFTGDGVGSVYPLDYKPHNTEVNVAGSVMLRGGVYQMLVGAPASGTEYLINFDARQLIICSGTQCGDNIIGSLVGMVIDYDRATPIIKYGEDKTSIDTYGPKMKVVVDKGITNPLMAQDIVTQTLSEFSTPSMQGDMQLQDVVSLTAGNTVVINLVNQNISSETYDILESSYDFTVPNCETDKVLKVKVSKRISDIVDTLKQLILDVKKMQAADMLTTDVISRVEFATGSVGMRMKNWEVSSNTLGSSFIYGSPGQGTNPQAGGVLGSIIISGINFLGDSKSAMVIQRSGGTW